MLGKTHWVSENTWSVLLKKEQICYFISFKNVFQQPFNNVLYKKLRLCYNFFVIINNLASLACNICRLNYNIINRPGVAGAVL